MKSWFKPTIENAPCPPFFVDNVYEIFINQTRENNLTSKVVEDIRTKCSIEIPTTTTTTTTSTSTSTTTTTTAPEPSTIPISPTTNGTATESVNVTSTTDTSLNNTVTETTVTTVTYANTTTQSNQTTSKVIGNKTTESVKTSTVQSTTLSYNTTIRTSENVTVTNVTIITGTLTEPVYSSGCNTICVIGIATGAVCLCLLLLLIIALATLFRKGRESKTRSRSRSRSRFGDMPDVDLYDSVDIRSSPSSKRNSHSSLFRRSGDFSRSPPVVFDNPAYRRSFELRPHRYNSWYDPEATDYSYSQINANLISRKSRSPERRSVSTSRLHDNHAPEHRRHGSSSSWHSSIREYVPKMLHSSSEGDFGQNSPYYHSSQNGLLHNGANSPSQRTLPRTPIEKRGKHKEMRPDFKHSKRSRSYDPDMSAGSGSWEESHFISMDDSRSRSQYIKNNPSKKNTSRGRRDRHKKGKEKRQHDIEIPFDRIYRTNSESRNNHLPIQHSNNSSYKGRSSNVSSNLHPISFKYNGPTDGYDRNRSLSSSDRSPDVNDYYMGQGRSFMDRRSDNNRRYSNRHSSYKPDSNEIYMFQTKL